jgi:hypothetical protein
LRIALAGWAFLVSCKSTEVEEKPPESNEQPIVKRVDVPAQEDGIKQSTAPETQGQVGAVPVKLYLDFVGIGAMHKTFFTDPRVTRKVQQKLLGHVSGSVGVLIGFEKNQGRIRVQVAPDLLVASLGTPDAIQLSSLTPLTQTAAFYRDWVASYFDLRVQNFEIGLDITPKKGVCKITVAGDPPLDGTEFAPCIEVDGTALCGELTEGVLRLPSAHHETVGRCL